MTKKKKRIILEFSISILLITSYIFFLFSIANNIEQTCFASDFNKVFLKEDSLKLGEVYDFSKIFNCKDWDQIIIVGGERANRTIIFLKEGVAIPPINYLERASGELIFYLIKNGKLISPPLEFYRSGFLYFESFNYFDYVSLDKEEAIFKCVVLETIGYDKEILSFELIH